MGLVFSSPGGLDVRHQGQVDVEDVLGPASCTELTDRLEEGQALDVADGAADLDDGRQVAASSAQAAWMRRLISSVMCGMTCTVRPRYSPLRSRSMTALVHAPGGEVVDAGLMRVVKRS